jgi:hypothetical protein
MYSCVYVSMHANVCGSYVTMFCVRMCVDLYTYMSVLLLPGRVLLSDVMCVYIHT